ncbi:MFS transporter [Saccharibacillus brassicae]|uniref:Multidrug efflux MFS transporter n=1 Tax=Saccharibacillus brassicae TaxID=2583377 RepID=A0A4Y6UTY0_SACBS|nr:MFS transporter [Saccharibacillus brassicae]QDH20038.1 multidrug efflux MFS transporter [Saccharibacillus brassicae]
MKSSPAWNNSLRLLSGGRFLSSAGLTGISPFIPYYLEEMNAGTPQEVLLWTGLSVSAPALSYALLTPVWGKIGDRWSRKWMVVRALVGLALSMMLMGFAQTPFQFFLFRLCQGAFGGISDASSAFVGSHAPADRRGSALGTLERASAAGLLAGPLLGSLCVHLWGSRPLLFLTAALTLAFALLAAWKLGDAQQSDRQVDSSQVSRPPALSAQTDGRGGIGHAFRSLLSHPMIGRLVLAGILFKLVDFATFTMFTPYVRELIPSDDAVLFVGLLLAMSSVGELLGSSWWGKRNDRRPPERNLKLAGLLCGVCVLAHAVPLGVAWLIVVRLLQGFAYSALLQTVMLQVLDSSSDRDRGVRIGATNSLLMAGQLIGPMLGVRIGGLWGLSSVYVVMGLVMLSALFLIPRSSAAAKKAAERLPLQSTKKG